MTKLVNIKNNSDFDELIDRSTIFGNPYTHLPTKTKAEFKVATRADSIIAFKKYFYERLESDPKFKEEVLKLKDKILACHCYPPLACHGLIIIEFLDGSSCDKT